MSFLGQFKYLNVNSEVGGVKRRESMKKNTWPFIFFNPSPLTFPSQGQHVSAWGKGAWGGGGTEHKWSRKRVAMASETEDDTVEVAWVDGVCYTEVNSLTEQISTDTENNRNQVCLRLRRDLQTWEVGRLERILRYWIKIGSTNMNARVLFQICITICIQEIINVCVWMDIFF